MNKVLFLHGMFAQNSKKPYLIRSLGFYVESPILSDWSFRKAKQTAQETFERLEPDIVVGSSRGAAVAMNIETKEVPLILLSPAWPIFGSQNKCKSNSIIIHSRYDSLVPLRKSEELSKRSGCELIIAGNTHRLNCKEGQSALAEVLLRYSSGFGFGL